MFSGILPKPAESLPYKFLLKHSNSFPVTEKMILAQQFIFALTFGSLSFCNFDLKLHLKIMKIGSLAFLLHFVGLLFFFVPLFCSILVLTVVQFPNFFIICYIASVFFFTFKT
jgi:hypothetical protein